MGCLLAKLLAVRFPITGLACQLPTLYCAILPSALTNQRAQVEVCFPRTAHVRFGQSQNSVEKLMVLGC